MQEQLKWGRSYISQLVTRQKALRLEQILAILDVIKVSPTDFFGELYGFERRVGAFQDDLVEVSGDRTLDDLKRQMRLNRRLVEAYAEVLVQRGLLPAGEVERVLRRAEDDFVADEDDEDES